MYETQTYDAILQRMLGRVPADIDKREGSVIYDALAPAAAELAHMYIELDVNLNLVFADTSSGEFLRRRAADFGVNWHQATKARRLGLFYKDSNTLMDVPLGSRFSLGDLNYKVIERLTLGNFVLECETAGIVGNSDYGSLLPIDFISGLSTATLSDVLILGEDDERDDQLRARFFAQVQSPGTSGNIADYKRWALSIAGVGAVQVIPLWDGAGTVKITVIDSEMQPATPQLVSSVQDYISPASGTGEGVAPIGADVTVTSAESVPLTVSATVVLSGSVTIHEIADNFRDAIHDYLKSIAFSADPAPKYVRIGSLLLDVDGVLDFGDLIVNGGTGNIPIGLGQVAVLEEVLLSD